MAQRSLDSEKEAILTRLAPVIDLIREDRGVANDFLVFAAQKGADIQVQAERVRKLRMKSVEPPMPAYFAFLLSDFWAQRQQPHGLQ